MKTIQILAGFITVLLTGCGHSDSTTATEEVGTNAPKETRTDDKMIPEPFRGTWLEVQAEGNSQSTLQVKTQSITWRREETTEITNYTIIDAKRVSFSASIVGSRAVFNEPSIAGSKMVITPAGAATSEGQATVTITITEQGLVLLVPEVKIDEGAYVRTLPAKTNVYTRKLQGGSATK